MCLLLMQTSVPIAAVQTPGHQSGNILYNIIKHAYITCLPAKIWDKTQDKNKIKNCTNTSRQKV